MLNLHFNFLKKRKKQSTTKTDTKVYVKVHKYDMDVEFFPSEDIHLLENGRFYLSDKFKEELLNTDDINRISIKYDIYPQNAVKVIKSKLKYAKTHK